MGITSCGLAALASFGICSLFGLPYGPMHSIIPCLLVGLGVDDMFVLVQAFDNEDSKPLSKEERLALAVKHAGVGITITSITGSLSEKL